MTLPTDFIKYITSVLGEQAQPLLNSLTEQPALSIRLNDKMLCTKEYPQVAWHPKGYYLDSRPLFTLDPLFHAGCYYVQEAASMFLYQVLNQFVSPDSLVLDMCAAPGGKSTIIADFLSENGLLIANEYIPNRANILAENLSKWGANAVITNADSAAFASSGLRFDAILVDAPCSGEGMFRKDEQAISDWSVENVQNCVSRGRYILDNAWQALKNGGILIYSTCTFNEYENEQQVDYLIDKYDAECLKIELKNEWNITQTAKGIHFYPHKTKGEGLFIAVIQKEGNENKKELKLPKKIPAKQDDLLRYVIDNKQKTTFVIDDTVYCCKKQNLPIILETMRCAKTVQPALPLAQIKGKNIKLHPALALSKELDRETVTEYEVDLKTALEFLSCQVLMLENAPKGLILITYKNIPLGWVKNVGNRCNNYYSQYWRIRMSIPTQLTDINTIIL